MDLISPHPNLLELEKTCDQYWIDYSYFEKNHIKPYLIDTHRRPCPFLHGDWRRRNWGVGEGMEVLEGEDGGGSGWDVK